MHPRHGPLASALTSRRLSRLTASVNWALKLEELGILGEGLSFLASFGSKIWLEANAWLIGAVTLLLAGGFQFSRLKYRCLDKCRTPLSFVTEYWRGRHDHRNALLLGVNHGLFCVGCCWALMLLMFGVGVGNVGWMLALGAIMAVEKNMPWGRKLSAPLGLALLGWGSLVLLNHSWSWQS